MKRLLILTNYGIEQAAVSADILALRSFASTLFPEATFKEGPSADTPLLITSNGQILGWIEAGLQVASSLRSLSSPPPVREGGYAD